MGIFDKLGGIQAIATYDLEDWVKLMETTQYEEPLNRAALYMARQKLKTIIEEATAVQILGEPSEEEKNELLEIFNKKGPPDFASISIIQRFIGRDPQNQSNAMMDANLLSTLGGTPEDVGKPDWGRKMLDRCIAVRTTLSSDDKMKLKRYETVFSMNIPEEVWDGIN
jgi:hypothetical protein